MRSCDSTISRPWSAWFHLVCSSHGLSSTVGTSGSSVRCAFSTLSKWLSILSSKACVLYSMPCSVSCSPECSPESCDSELCDLALLDLPALLALLELLELLDFMALLTPLAPLTL